MPIRPENKARYPKDWKHISAAIRDRAGNRCEGSPAFPDCRAPNGAIGYRNDRSEWVTCLASGTADDLASVQYRYGDLERITRIVLTVAHLDHTPENCDPSNLRAMCQRCHLHYDGRHHAETAYMTRRSRAQTPDMFSETI